MGAAIAVGNFDSDEILEILLGCSGCAREGASYWLSGRGYVLEPIEISGLVAVSEVSRLDLLPYKDARGLGQVVSAIDLNDDGVSDLAIGAPWTDYPEGNLPGTVYAISSPFRTRLFLPLVLK